MDQQQPGHYPLSICQQLISLLQFLINQWNKNPQMQCASAAKQFEIMDRRRAWQGHI